MKNASRSGAGSYKGKTFKYFQEMQILTDEISSNSTTTSVPRMRGLSPSLSSALPLLSCSYNLPATASTPLQSS